ncbi:hypothetical protein HPP92_012120 [Vanilla planifolia]|uniref:NAB domain-containing protein n=1 Tax=Vanilla planifolia TaxID=51239 RepID=A0A835R745_VANPL|nr:hypothetical protein HPP92_012120 [Vanilla planifolia]
MIKLIEEDADSFARRAEMYYKKRPDLMKLVEQFYRAYRALAEKRYDRVTGALRQAHRTIAVAFPNEIQLMLPDEPPSGSFDIGEEETSESFSRAQLMNIQWDGKSLGAIAPLIIKEGLKHFNCFFADEEAQQKFGDNLVMKIMEFKEDEAKDSKCKLLVEETEKLLKEKKDLQDQISMESMHADNAKAELQIVKDAISQLKSELEAAVARYQASQKMISNLELEISERQEEFQHLSDEMRIKTSKLNIAEERCAGLERKNYFPTFRAR